MTGTAPVSSMGSAPGHLHRMAPVGEPYRRPGQVGPTMFTATACAECGAAGTERRA